MTRRASALCLVVALASALQVGPSQSSAAQAGTAQAGAAQAIGAQAPAAPSAGAAAHEDPIDLPLGDPARKQQSVTIAVDQIVDTHGGAAVTPAEIAERLRETQILLIGEHHTSRESHRVQRRVLEALYRAGRPVIVGLEMFPYTQQASLDRWSRGDGTLTEAAFLRDAAWYEHWGYHWGYYRDIFLFARDRRLPMVAVNAPRDVVTAVRKKGFANLTPDEARHIPTGIDVDSAEHLTLFKAYFEAGDATHTAGLSDAAWKDMLSAQATWDATMGMHAVRAWQEAKDPAAIVVVLAGSGHVAYGLGIERQVRRGFEGNVSTLIPVDVKDAPVSVRASYANFVWGVPEEPRAAYASLGVSTMAPSGQGGAATGRRVIAVEKDSPAARAGMAVGDLLLAIDGQPIVSRAVLNRLIAEKDWGDVADLRVRRGTEEIALRAAFRR